MRTQSPYMESAEVYDAIYAKWDYRREAGLLRLLVRRHCKSGGRDLLDVACGTGKHLELLRRHFRVEGLDRSAQMLAIARRRLPGVRLHRASFHDFDLRRKFDVVICMGSAIGYARTMGGLRRAVVAMGRHLRPGGVLFVVPWVLRSEWKEGLLHLDERGHPGLWIARMAHSGRRGNVSLVEMHHLVGSRTGIVHYAERHELGLFSGSEYVDAARRAGLDARFIPKSKDWFRGLLLGTRPADGATAD